MPRFYGGDRKGHYIRRAAGPGRRSGIFGHHVVARRCVRCGMDAKMTKPEEPKMLAELIESPARILGSVSSEDRGEHVAETFLEFRATGRVVHLDALAFATDQAGFTQDFEMLGEGRLGQGAVVDLAEVGAIQRAFRCGHFRVDLGAHRIGQGIEEALDSNVAESGMEERPH